MELKIQHIPTWINEAKYLAQDANGQWCLYVDLPIYWKPGYWKNALGPQDFRWADFCKTEQIMEDNMETIFSIKENKWILI